MKKLIAMVTVIASVMVVAGVASASHTDYGRLWAEGTGTSILEVGQAKVQMVVDGDVVITGPANLNVQIDSTDRALAPEASDGTYIELTDFTGEIIVTGSEYTVTVEGEIMMRGKGWGSASFVGTGRWKTLHRHGVWPASLPDGMVEFGGPAD
ncbi:MAG: hypothetical protein HKN07_06030 [Acidimicrobiia bacterium]|nr:hypothetical protein [Acidimicrobiia bacterium]